MWRRLAALCAWGLISAGMTFAGAAPALAEAAGSTAAASDGGSVNVGNDMEQTTKVTTAQTSALAVGNLSNFVHATVKSRFGMAPSSQPQSVSVADQKDAGDELNELATVLQTDMLVPAAQQALNEGNFDHLLVAGAKMANKALDAVGRPYGLWFRGASTLVDHEKTAGAYSGSTLSLGGGADYRFGNKILAGLALTYEQGDIAATFNSVDLAGEGATVAPYIGWRPLPQLMLDASIGVSTLDYNAQRSDNGVSAQFDALRVFGGLNGTGTFRFGPLRLSPTAGLQYLEERQDSHSDGGGVSISDQTVNVGRLRSGMEIGYTLDREYIGFGLEPYVRSSGEWDFQQPAAVTLSTDETVNPSRYGGGLAGGLNLFNDNGLTGKVEGRLDSIGRADYESVAIQGSVRYGF